MGTLDTSFHYSPFTCFNWLYPKASINPIIAPKPVLRYGLQVSPQVLPALRETRLSPYPITAPIARPIKTFKVIVVLVLL
jgi:hypothetical protein